MKKALLLILACVFLLSGCISIEVEEPTGGDTVSIEATEKVVTSEFDEATVLSQLEVTEYSYKSSVWHYAFLVIANKSEFDIEVSVDIKFYDKNGDLVGAKNGEQEAFESGTEIVMYFMPDEAYAKMEYELSVEEEDWYECVVSDLTYESTTAKKKEIVSVTNNGTEAAEFVEGSALFFKGDKVVGFEQTYFTDDDSELKPGKTITKEMDCYKKYDSVKFFFTGRR